MREIYAFLRLAADLRICLATLRKSVRKFWFCKLALTCVALRVRLACRVLHCATLKKSIKSLPQSLRKVESSFSFCNACGNNKNCETGCCLGMVHLVIFGATCVVTKLRDKLHEKLPSVTAPFRLPLNVGITMAVKVMAGA